MSRRILILSTILFFCLLPVLFFSFNYFYESARKSAFDGGFVAGQVKLLNMMSYETGDFPKNSDPEDYRKIYATKTLSVFVHKDEGSRAIVVLGTY